jgi:AcrR family transcriptional regulator
MASGDRLDRRAVVSAAARIADAEGVSALTLSRLAKEVDRHVASLYTHVKGIDGLHREVALLAQREIGEELWRAAVGRSGEEALMALAGAYRDYVRRHPGRYDVLTRYRPRDDDEFRSNARHVAEPIRATLRSFGLGEREVFHAHRAFSAAIRGLAVPEAAGGYEDANADETFRQIVALFVLGLTSGRWPRLSPPPPRKQRTPAAS